MSDWFYPGQKVVCLNAEWPNPTASIPCPLVKGGTYTVGSVELIKNPRSWTPLGHGRMITNSTRLILAEVVNPYNAINRPPETLGFCASRFRPVVDETKSVDREMVAA